MVEQILAYAMFLAMVALGAGTIIWGYYFGKETDRMRKEYLDRQERLNKIREEQINWAPRQVEFNPGKWISDVKQGD